MKNWFWESYASDNKESGSMSTGSIQPTTPSTMGTTFTLAKQYGQAVNVGGGVTMHTGSIILSSCSESK